MTEEINWKNTSEIILSYRNLNRTQGLKIYYKTIDYDNTGEEVIVSQIVPADFDCEYSEEVPISRSTRMSKFLTGIRMITWHIYDKEFTVNLDHITKIEIIDNAIDEIMKEEGLI